MFEKKHKRMERIMKKIWIMLLVVLCAVLFASCSPDAAGKDSSSSESGGKTSIAYSRLAATWVESTTIRPLKIVFASDKQEAEFFTVSEEDGQYYSKGTYEVKISGDIVEFSRTDSSFKCTCTVTDSALTLVLCEGSKTPNYISLGDGSFSKQS